MKPEIQEGEGNMTIWLILDGLHPKNRKAGTEITGQIDWYCEVRDISAIHVDVLLNLKVGGQSFLATGGQLCFILLLFIYPPFRDKG